VSSQPRRYLVIAIALAATLAARSAEPPPSRARRPSNVILLTGFEPFGGLATNTSWEVARRLNGEIIGGKRVVALEIPVVWEKTRAAIARAVAAHDPDVAVVMGVAWWGVVAVEGVGRNMRGTHPDNEGAGPESYEIYARGHRALRTRLPVNAILAELRGLDIPCRSSDTAGTYLCNESLYTILYETGSHALPAGLLHLPRAGPDRARKPTPDERTVRAVTVDELVVGVRAALRLTVAAAASGEPASPRLRELRDAHHRARAADPLLRPAVSALQAYYTHAADEVESLAPGSARRVSLCRALVAELTADRQRYVDARGMYTVVFWCTLVLGRLKAASGDVAGAYHEFNDVTGVDTSLLPAAARSFFDNLRTSAFHHKARVALEAGQYDAAILTADAMFAPGNRPAGAGDYRGAATLLIKAEALFRKTPADGPAALRVLESIRTPPHVAHARSLSDEIRQAMREPAGAR